MFRRKSEAERADEIYQRQAQEQWNRDWEARQAATTLMRRLRTQGTQVALGANGRLLVRPAPDFCDADRAAIREQRAAILAALGGEAGVEVF